MRHLITFVLCLTVVFSAVAQKKVITLDQAKQVALERNLNVVQAQNNLASTQSQVLAARGQWLPTLSASTGWSRSQAESQSSGYQSFGGTVLQIPKSTETILSNRYSGAINANWTVFDGLSREASNSAATARAIASE